MILREATLKNGRRAVFTYSDLPPGFPGEEKAFVVHRVDAHVDGEAAGYLNISYVASERLDECFPTIWHWAARATGWSFDPDDLASTWYACHSHSRRVPASLRERLSSVLGLSRDMVPDEATMRADLEALEQERFWVGDDHMTIHERKAEWLVAIVDRPWVDYIRVLQGQEWPEPAWTYRRLGLGTLLYEAGARWLAETRGYPLWGSSLRSESAEAVWESMQAEGRLPIREADRGDGKVLPLIDFT